MPAPMNDNHRDDRHDVAPDDGSETFENSEVRYLAEHTDLSPNQARALVERHGRDRDKLLQLAKSMKAES